MRTLIIILLLVIICSPVYSDNPPQRIISLGPVLTEELFLLGEGDKIVGVSTYCNKPKEVQKKEKAGEITDINIEKALMLKPDLVLFTEMASPQQIEKVKELGIKTEVFPYYESFSDICKQFIRLAKLVGKEAKAKEVISEVKKDINSIMHVEHKKPKPRVFIQIGAKPLFTATGHTYINDLIKMAGGVNIAANLTGTGLYSREEVVKQNPDIIMIAGMGIGANKEKETWKKLKSINAVKNNRIYAIDPYKICSLTPVSFVDTLREFEKMINSHE